MANNVAVDAALFADQPWAGEYEIWTNAIETNAIEMMMAE